MSGTGDSYSRAWARHYEAKRAMGRAVAEAERKREAAGKPSFMERWDMALKESGGNTKRALEILEEQERKS